jgi:hypothetical protein
MPKVRTKHEYMTIFPEKPVPSAPDVAHSVFYCLKHERLSNMNTQQPSIEYIKKIV